MVLAAALISMVVAAPQAEPQSAPPQPPPPRSASAENQRPYSLEGVRRAYPPQPLPSIDTTSVVRDPNGYRMALESRSATSNPCSLFITTCASPWQATEYPTWHDQFLAMAGPQNYSIPSSSMNNAQRVEAVATSIGFGLAIQAIASLIQDQVVKSSHDRKQRKVEKVRAEIRGEVEELERLNAAARASNPAAVR